MGADNPKAVEVGDKQVERLIMQLRNRVTYGVSGPFELCTRAADLIESQARQIATLTAELKEAADDISALYQSRETVFTERDRAVEAINEHNKDCAMMCGEGEQEGVRCKYRPYFPRHCPECPRDLMIEIPLAASLQPQDTEHQPLDSEAKREV